MGRIEIVVFLTAQYIIAFIVYMFVLLGLQFSGVRVNLNLFLFSGGFTIVQLGILLQYYIKNRITRRKTNRILGM